MIVSFRGTEPSQFKDILADANFFKQDFSERGWPEGWGRGHRGFLKAYMAINRQLTTLVSTLRDRDDIPDIWITGHSLGGALATVFASGLLQVMDRYPSLKGKLKGLYTFGSPRVGNEDFKEQLEDYAEKYGAVIMRFKNVSDIVTRVPNLYFEHVGQIVWLAEEGKKSPLEMTDEDPAWLFGSAGDHSMLHYYNKTLAAAMWAREKRSWLDSGCEPAP